MSPFPFCCTYSAFPTEKLITQELFPSEAPIETLPVLAGVSKPSNEKKCGAAVLKEHFHEPSTIKLVLKP